MPSIIIPDGELTKLHDKKTGTTKLRNWLERITLLANYYSNPPKKTGSTPRIFWRGQARPWRIEPGIHTRVRLSSFQGDLELEVQRRTNDLLSGGRKIGLPGFPAELRQLPDMQLLAFMQHQGFATPLLDFTADVLTAMAMACFDKESLDEPGLLICYRHDEFKQNRIPAFIHEDYQPTVQKYCVRNDSGSDELAIFEPPYITPRQRIQRGLFVLGKYLSANDNTVSSISLNLVNGQEQSMKFFETNREGKQGVRHYPLKNREAMAIKILPAFKKPLKAWLEQHHLLNEDYVYPEPLSSEFHKNYKAENDRFSCF